jgi:hypothetical protein
MPSAGIGPKPRINRGETGTRKITPARITAAAAIMLPVPRITAARPLINQSSTLPPKTTFE